MSDWLQCQKKGDMVANLEIMERLEGESRREFHGCHACKYQFQVFQDVYACEIEEKPYNGREYCGKWVDK